MSQLAFRLGVAECPHSITTLKILISDFGTIWQYIKEVSTIRNVQRLAVVHDVTKEHSFFQIMSRTDHRESSRSEGARR